MCSSCFEIKFCEACGSTTNFSDGHRGRMFCDECGKEFE